MQSLARAVFRGARIAGKGYTGQRFMTAGYGATKSYVNPGPITSVVRGSQGGAGSEAKYQLILAELRAMGVKLDKIATEKARLRREFQIRFVATLAGCTFIGFLLDKSGTKK